MTGAVHDSRGNSPQSDTQTSTPGPRPGPATPTVARTPHGDVEGVRAALGNRGFGNYVRTLSRQPVQQAPTRPPAQSVTVYLVGPPPPIHAAVRATETNRQLAELIDEIDKLSNADVIERRRVEVLEAQAKSGVDLRSHELALEAAEYVATYRGLAPLKPLLHRRHPGPPPEEHPGGARGGDTRAPLVQGGIRGDLGRRVETTTPKRSSRSFEKSFRLEFKKQARATAFAMLKASKTEIEKVLQGYGVPLDAARRAGHRLSGNGVLGDEVRYVLSEMKGSADVNTTAYHVPALISPRRPGDSGSRSSSRTSSSTTPVWLPPRFQ